ncbi:MAG: type I methionyl aminopeptidase [Acidimicrobiales bacterium]|nr:type I methionyl aminopeptidase [Acidimicrobiales bacterium]
MVVRRTPEEIATMRRAGRVVAEMHAVCRDAIRPGVTTSRLDRLARDVLDRRGATSNFLGYHGFPAVVCTSVNDEVVHGIPGGRVLEEGDLVSIDCGAVVDGWHGDAAFTMGVGEVTPADDRLIETGRRALDEAIGVMEAGNTIGDIGHATEAAAIAGGGSVLREYTGHGIGRAMHEAPDVPNHGTPGKGRTLKPGMALAIEPMVVAGDPTVTTLADGWTVVTADGSRAVHWEHSIAITDDGPEVLTRP